MAYPKSREEWWNMVRMSSAELLGIVYQFNPKQVDDAKRAMQERNPKLAMIFEITWQNAPDSRTIHDLPGWGLLCNLCSESHVLQ